MFSDDGKDLVRLPRAQRRRLEEIAPLLTLRLTMRLNDPEQALDGLEARLERHGA